MKLFLITLLVVSNMLSICALGTEHKDIVKSKGQDNDTETKQKAEQLKKSYQKLSASPHSAEYQQEYFEAFPNTFLLFNKLFGYSHKEPLADSKYDFNSPLNREAESYVPAFFKLTEIEKTLYYNRMIDISIKGRWYADGVNYFKMGMQEKFIADINVFCELLSKRSEKEIKSFWYFYFDSPAPLKKIPEELQIIKKIDHKMVPLMELALKEVQQAWKD
jgi:hypothetical protein